MSYDFVQKLRVCPHCGSRIQYGSYRGHLRAVVSVNGRNVCPGMPSSPKHKGHLKNEARRPWKKAV